MNIRCGWIRRLQRYESRRAEAGVKKINKPNLNYYNLIKQWFVRFLFGRNLADIKKRQLAMSLRTVTNSIHPKCLFSVVGLLGGEWTKHFNPRSKWLLEGLSAKQSNSLILQTLLKKTKHAKKKKILIVGIDVLSFSLEIITWLNSWKIKPDSITVKTHSVRARTGS